MSRAVALITPAVTVGCVSLSRNPNGLPIAIAYSPTTSASLSPSGAADRSVASTLSTARS